MQANAQNVSETSNQRTVHIRICASGFQQDVGFTIIQIHGIAGLLKHGVLHQNGLQQGLGVSIPYGRGIGGVRDQTAAATGKQKNLQCPRFQQDPWRWLEDLDLTISLEVKQS
jgi:hypothetical protein